MKIRRAKRAKTVPCKKADYLELDIRDVEDARLLQVNLKYNTVNDNSTYCEPEKAICENIHIKKQNTMTVDSSYTLGKLFGEEKGTDDKWNFRS